ncbi:exopolysaccharide biosynthesis protein [Pseudoxanthomonas sp. F37]|uniref:exopolysaccharide biosynthesis protein n=1 Tax=Pseudoxanthomonas TaxID=83618 RepID=UPI001FD5B11E|nr:MULTISPECIES: exopolysaccharide biosynthesis protein [Pseudoxanthomonas]UOV04775.1 exopolysaccharide biosynthesis protein [Pseudoxanthomonas mexicana]UOV09788.1 exopolysaccharide biosynthesis protein [Pseudoxanthomonas sp. F37]
MPTTKTSSPDMTREDNHTTTVALLDGFANGDPDDVLRLGDLLKDFGPAAFGMLLFLGVLPAFIPVPGVGGAVGGPLVILVGVQLLLGMRKLWLPGFLARRGPHRSAMMRFRQRMAPWLRRLEKLVRPRMTAFLDNRIALSFTGLLLVLLGVLLALPIPFTNYVFGFLLLLFAFALLERDGALLLVAWVAGGIAIVVFGFLSGNLVESLTQLFARWF